MHQARTSNAIRSRMAPKSHLPFFTAVEFYRQRKSPDIPPKVAISDWTEHWLAERSRRSTCIGLAILLSSFSLFAIALACLLACFACCDKSGPMSATNSTLNPFSCHHFFCCVFSISFSFFICGLDQRRWNGIKGEILATQPPKGLAARPNTSKTPYLPTYVNQYPHSFYTRVARIKSQLTNAGVFCRLLERWRCLAHKNEEYQIRLSPRPDQGSQPCKSLSHFSFFLCC